MAVSNRKYDDEYIKIQIKYKDPFDFQLMYQSMWYWCQNEGYEAKNGNSGKGGGFDNFETVYRERHYVGFSELWCNWEMRKKLNKYIMHDMEVRIQILGKAKTEVVIDGKKQKMDTGELVIEIEGKIVFDKKFEEDWKNNLYTKFPFNIIKKIFKIRTIKDTLDYWEDKSFAKHHSLADALKKAIGMKL
ncbi:MAG: hypothetical protein WC755_05285 [Candidatus Woesearchaeota archaeon]|jgi:hypothetical protein